MDIWSKAKRSSVMSKIGSKNTKPEILLRSTLFKLGYRFRIHRKDLPGKPDIVFPSKKIAIFVHGCFWHLHQNCNEGRIPSSNNEFWFGKLKRNVERDAGHQHKLLQIGWRVVVAWECETEKNLEKTITRIRRLLDKPLKAHK